METITLLEMFLSGTLLFVYISRRIEKKLQTKKIEAFEKKCDEMKVSRLALPMSACATERREVIPGARSISLPSL